jgi:hypothetical protein
MDKVTAKMGGRFIGDPLKVTRLTDRITKAAGSVRATLKRVLQKTALKELTLVV